MFFFFMSRESELFLKTAKKNLLELINFATVGNLRAQPDARSFNRFCCDLIQARHLEPNIIYQQLSCKRYI